jgi:hypothetical protein
MSDLPARIKAAYERDMSRKPQKVYRAEDLPLSFDDITDEWLTSVLCKDHPGAAVVGHQLGAPDNGSANRRKITVAYNEAGRRAGLPTALFCKASHDLVNRIVLGVSGGAHSEVVFYGKLRPLLSIEAPQPYFARYDAESFNSLIILGDISGHVTEFCSHKTPMPRQRVESQISLLANMHGSCYRDPELKTRLQALATWPEFFAKTLDFGMQDGASRGFLAAEEVVPPRLYRRYEEVWPATMKSVELHNRLPHTLMHGDVHLKNWYVAGNGEMGLGDWQCATRGHWGRDLTYTIATALTIENRRAWEQDLVRAYLEQMRAAGGPKVAFDEAWLQYRQQLATALTWWAVTLTPPAGLPDMQPRDITLEFLRRITTAMDDHETLDSLR